MSAAELLALAERVEGATGPDMELDAEIWLAEVDGATRKQWSYVHKTTGRECHVDETRDASRRLITVPTYTASLDAAMTLVPEGWNHGYRWSAKHGTSRALIEFYPEPPFAPIELKSIESRKCATPALALTAACLRARAAIGQQGEGK